MLLVIHNLPSHMQYKDIKALLFEKCGLRDMILDNLLPDNGNKRVTVGLADEADAAVLVRNMNGVYVDGLQLYIEDVRQKTAANQPYRPPTNIPTENFNKPFYQSQQDKNPPPYVNPMQNQYQNQMSSMPLMPFMNPNMPNMGFFSPYMMPNAQGGSELTQYPIPGQDKSKDSYRDRNRMDTDRGESYDRQRSSTHGWEEPSSYGREQSPPYRRQESPPYGRRNSPSYGRHESSDYGREDNSSYGRGNRNDGDKYRDNYGQSSRWDKDRDERDNDRQRDDHRSRDRDRRSRRESPKRDSYNSERNDRKRPSRFDRSERDSYSNDRKNDDRDSRNPQKKRRPDSRNDRNRPGTFSNMPDNSTFVQPKPPAPINREVKEFGAKVSNKYKLDNRNPPGNPGVNPQAQVRYPVQARGFDSNGQNKYKVDNRKTVQTNVGPRGPTPLTKPGNKPWEANQQSPAKRPKIQDNLIDSRKKNKKLTNINLPAGEAKNQGYNAPSAKSAVLKHNAWCENAVALIAREILASIGAIDYAYMNRPVLSALKTCIKSRIDVVMGEDIAKQIAEIYDKYRASFPTEDDLKLFEAVLEKLEIPNTPDIYTSVKVPPGGLEKAHLILVSKGSKDRSKDSSKTEKPVAPLDPNKIPKYPMGDKNIYKAQKQSLKEEAREQKYKLDDVQTKEMEEQMQAFTKIFDEACEDPMLSLDKTIQNRIKDVVIEDFVGSFQLRLTKRILNIKNNMGVRVFSSPKPPRREELEAFLKDYDVISMKKCQRTKMFVVQCDSYEGYDALCALESAMIGDLKVRFKPLHVTGMPKKLTERLMKGPKHAKQMAAQNQKAEFQAELKDLKDESKTDSVQDDKNEWVECDDDIQELGGIDFTKDDCDQVLETDQLADVAGAKYGDEKMKSDAVVTIEDDEVNNTDVNPCNGITVKSDAIEEKTVKDDVTEVIGYMDVAAVIANADIDEADLEDF